MRAFRRAISLLASVLCAAAFSAEPDSVAVIEEPERNYIIIRTHLPDSPGGPQAAVSQGRYTVNFGSREGVRPGSIFRVYRLPEEYIGLVRVERVWRDSAWVSVVNLEQKIDLANTLPLAVRYRLLPKYVILETVYFDAGKPVFTAAMHNRLRYIARFILSLPDHSVVLEGHTDNTGTAKKNIQLSKDRAEQIGRYLHEVNLIPEFQLHAIGYGEAQPISTNDTPEGRRLNRRVDMVLVDRLPEP